MTRTHPSCAVHHEMQDSDAQTAALASHRPVLYIQRPLQLLRAWPAPSAPVVVLQITRGKLCISRPAGSTVIPTGLKLCRQLFRCVRNELGPAHGELNDLKTMCS